MDRFLHLTIAFAAMLTLSAPAAQAGLHLNGPALDGRQVALPDAPGRAVDDQRLPGKTGGIAPIDQRWPGPGQGRRVRR
jgi:hypothetical protein